MRRRALQLAAAAGGRARLRQRRPIAFTNCPGTAAVDLRPDSECLVLEDRAAAVDHRRERHLRRGVVEAAAMCGDVVTKLGEIVVVAEHVGEAVGALRELLHPLRGRRAQDLLRVPEVLHALAPFVEVFAVGSFCARRIALRPRR